MRPGYQEQILYILNKHHSIVTVELGDAVTDDILQLIDSAKREGYEQEIVLNKAQFGNFVVVNKSDDPMTLRQKFRTLREVWKWL